MAVSIVPSTQTTVQMTNSKTTSLPVAIHGRECDRLPCSVGSYGFSVMLAQLVGATRPGSLKDIWPSTVSPAAFAGDQKIIAMKYEHPQSHIRHVDQHMATEETVSHAGMKPSTYARIIAVTQTNVKQPQVTRATRSMSHSLNRREYADGPDSVRGDSYGFSSTVRLGKTPSRIAVNAECVDTTTLRTCSRSPHFVPLVDIELQADVFRLRVNEDGLGIKCPVATRLTRNTIATSCSLRALHLTLQF